MRVILGASLLAGTFAVAYVLSGIGMVGFANPSALVLIGLGPLAVAIIAQPWTDLWQGVWRAVQALRFDEASSSRRVMQGLEAVARAHKSGHPEESVRIAEAAPDEVVRLAALLLLKRYDERSLREVLVGRVLALVAQVRRAEDLFVTLARLAPAFGLIGTIIGFIQLLRHLEDPSKLGPAMAVALTATLYGIGLSYCLYHPLARSLGTYAKKLIEQGKLVEQAVVLVARGRGAPSDLKLLSPDGERQKSSDLAPSPSVEA